MAGRIWPRFAAPAHVGRLPATATRRTGHADTPGADARIAIDVDVADNRVSAAAFRAFGCPASVAAADWVCERVTGLALEHARGLAASEVEAALELAAEQRFCALLAVDALAAALPPAATRDDAVGTDCDNGSEDSYGH